MGFFTVPNTKPTSQEYAGRVRSDLANNPQFAAWSRGAADIVADPHKFGITYLPHGAWIDKQGNVVTTDTGIPTAAKLLPFVPVALGAATGFGGAAAGGAAASGGALPATIPGSYASTAYAAGGFGVPGGTAAGVAAGHAGVAGAAGLTAQQMYDAGMFAGPAATAGANQAGGLGVSSEATKQAVERSLRDSGVSQPVIQHLLSDPRTYMGLAALLPSLTGGGGNSPFGGDTAGLMDEARKSLELQRHRVEQAQPVYDTLVNMSYGMSPKAYRGPAPQGYTANKAPEGAYEFTAPQFGR